MTVTVPTAIRALSCGSDELTRSTTSYLQLAAIHHGRLLAQYSIQIISNIINGKILKLRKFKNCLAVVAVESFSLKPYCKI